MSDVLLRQVSAAEFDTWYAWEVDNYAKEHVAAGNWSEAEALERSQAEFSMLLPDGAASPGNHLFTVVDSQLDEAVGMIWFAERSDNGQPPYAFVYDIVIWEAQRGRGYGKAAMLDLEEKVREIGLHRIALHVFGHNERAVRLYEHIGYRPTNILMSKEIG